MGGGAVVLFASQNPSLVSKVIAWNPVQKCDRWSDEAKAQLAEKGYVSYNNGRTNQELRVNQSYFDELEANADQRDVLAASAALKSPLLVVQGDKDPTVLPEHSRLVAEANPSAQLKTIAGGDHVFNCGHPFTEASREWNEALWASLEFAKA